MSWEVRFISTDPYGGLTLQLCADTQVEVSVPADVLEVLVEMLVKRVAERIGELKQ